MRKISSRASGQVDTTSMDGKVSRNELIAKLLDVASLRQKVIAQNIANVNTPGYRHMEVSFEDTFNRLINQHNAAAAVKVEPRIVEGSGGAERVDGNNVDIDAEMGRLTKNALLTSAFTQILASRGAAEKAAIAGR
jgi:flagellar basal-body rod protein FlgB